MIFFRTEHKTTTRNGDRIAHVDKPKALPQEAQVFHVEWNSKGLVVTWWIPDQIMPVGGFTEK